MRILFLTHSLNSLAQRLYVELSGRGHEVFIEFDINDNVAIEAVALFQISSSRPSSSGPSPRRCGANGSVWW
ncbi:MAG: hypothetical protein M5R42_18165 [Rhodocyclaceae bacterium]|nr:hypothetical protein [Rhodocyclaceae bacterium]